jgi:trk system potassium uptake protein TrkA
MNVAILGLGRFGTELAQELTRIGVDVLAVDHDRERADELAEAVALAADGDVTDLDFLRTIALPSYDSVVVAIGSQVATSVLVTLTLKRRLFIRHVVAKASTRDHAKALELAGADVIISPEQEAATQLAHTLGSRHVGEYLSLGGTYGVTKIRAPIAAQGKRLGDVRGLQEGNRVVLLARLRGDNVTFNPSLDERVEAGDSWLVAGLDEALRRIEL